MYICVLYANTCGFPDNSVIWIYGHMAWLLSVRPLFLCPAIKGGKLPKHFPFFAFNSQIMPPAPLITFAKWRRV